MGDSSYKGISAAQDSRFSNKESALLRKLKFPPHFDTKVDMTKVEISVIKPWIARRVTELLGFEDDVVLEYAAGMLEEQRFPDVKKMQIQLTGFLEDKTADFMGELWELLISAQDSPGGRTEAETSIVHETVQVETTGTTVAEEVVENTTRTAATVKATTLVAVETLAGDLALPVTPQTLVTHRVVHRLHLATEGDPPLLHRVHKATVSARDHDPAQ
ncbi:hypothetical protein [Sporisorium scitamineum]|uniref:PWI domain-containing protein n=1 Tax=Sporisorium scitamineum TaxID=49012 RepID=A0A0F7S0V0_9BASI|nr:hypothetical protein [Sporisorium scitamineum]